MDWKRLGVFVGVFAAASVVIGGLFAVPRLAYLAGGSPLAAWAVASVAVGRLIVPFTVFAGFARHLDHQVLAHSIALLVGCLVVSSILAMPTYAQGPGLPADALAATVAVDAAFIGLAGLAGLAFVRFQGSRRSPAVQKPHSSV